MFTHKREWEWGLKIYTRYHFESSRTFTVEFERLQYV